MLTEQFILLAEDDPNDVLLIERAFQKAGMRRLLKVVRDGEQAIQYLSGEGPYAAKGRKSPVLVLAGVGLLLLARRFPAEAIVCIAVSLYFFALNSGYYLPYGGISPGPRLATSPRSVSSWWSTQPSKTCRAMIIR